LQIGDINASRTLDAVRRIDPDLIAIAAFGQILREGIIEVPRLACINLHPSLLPAYRGPNPFYWVLANGETETGITVHHVDTGIDTGDIVLQRRLPLEPDETEATLRDRMLPRSAELFVRAVDALADGSAQRIAQDPDRASYFSHPPRGRSTL